jgi:hypothetical protein
VDREMANYAPPPDHQTTEPRSQNVILNGCQAETVVGLPWAAGSCPWVGKLRTVLPLTVGIRDGVVQLVSSLGSAVLSARAELGCIITSALPVATVLTRQRARTCSDERDGGWCVRRRAKFSVFCVIETTVI